MTDNNKENLQTYICTKCGFKTDRKSSFTRHLNKCQDITNGLKTEVKKQIKKQSKNVNNNNDTINVVKNDNINVIKNDINKDSDSDKEYESSNESTSAEAINNKTAVPKVATLDTKITLSNYLITVLRKLKDLELQVASLTVLCKINSEIFDGKIYTLQKDLHNVNTMVGSVFKVKPNVIDFDK